MLVVPFMECTYRWQVDTTGVAPLRSVVETNILLNRSTAVTEGGNADELLQSATHAEGRFYVVSNLQRGTDET